MFWGGEGDGLLGIHFESSGFHVQEGWHWGGGLVGV